MRLLFRVREREHAAVICLPRLRKVTSSGSRNLPVAQPGTDVMRDVLRLVDVDLLQNCNGRSTIAQADDLLKRVVRHGGLLIRHDELPSRVAALRGGVRGLPPRESEGDTRQCCRRMPHISRKFGPSSRGSAFYLCPFESIAPLHFVRAFVLTAFEAPSVSEG